MKKIISPCLCKVYTSSGNEATARAFCKIQFENGRLSITGVIGPLRSGGYRGSAGQCVDEIREGCPCDEWTREMLDKFCSIWDEWHLFNALSDEQKVELHCTGFSELDSMMAQWLV